MDYLPLAVAIAFAVFWHRGAHAEKASPYAWVGLSLVISAGVIFLLQKGWIAVVLGQVVLFVGITLYRLLSDSSVSGE